MILLLALAAPLLQDGHAPLQVQPVPDLGLSAASCARCHGRTHDDWAASQHATAYTDPRFQSSWRAWPEGWCLMCHLPLAEAQAEITPTGTPAVLGVQVGSVRPPGPLASEGVSCAVCHVRDGQILSAEPPGWMARLAHPIRAEPALAQPDFCGSCHDFPFQNHTPRQPFTFGAEPLQDTLDEWAGSQAAAEGQTCQTCHLPAGRHTFAGGHDLDLVRRALRVSVVPTDAGADVTLRASGVGHRLPTGDPCRRLELQLCADPDCDQVVGRARFGRTFAPTDTTWELVDDTTIPPATPTTPAERRLLVPISAPPVAWRLWTRWVDPRTEPALTPDQASALLGAGPVPTLDQPLGG